MKNLLSSKDLRILTILEQLKNATHFTSNILTITNTTQKTLNSDIDYINSTFYPLKIVKNNNNELKLTMPKNYSFSYVYSKILENSIEFRFLEIIFFETESNLQNLADHLFISSSSLRRIITKLNKSLANLNITITFSPLRIIGKESAIRNFFIQYFMEKHANGFYPFNKIQKKILDNLLNFILKKNCIQLNYTDLEKLRVTTMISLIRIQNNHYNKLININNSIFDFSLGNNWILKQSFKTIFKITLSEETVFHMVPFLFENRFFFSIEHLIVVANTDTKVNIIKNNFSSIIDNLSNKFELTCPNKNSLLVDLCNAYFLNYGAPFILYDFYTEFIDSFMIMKPDLIKFVKSEFIELFKNEKFEHYHLNNYIYILVTRWKDLYINIESNHRIPSIGVFYNTDFEQSIMIQNMIEFRFGKKVCVTTINDPDIQNILNSFSEYDLIVTNISGLENENVICFSIFPTFKDWNNLQKSLSKLF